MTSTDRPAPVREAARLWGLVTGGISALVAFGVTANALTVDQAAAVTGLSTATDVLIAAVVGVITGGSSLLAAFRTASTAEPKVTPISDPRVTAPDGNLVQLVPLAPHIPNAGQFDPSGGV